MSFYVTENVERDYRSRVERMVRCVRESGISFYQVGVFGSYARNDYKVTSDIDFCIVVHEQPSRAKRGWLRDDAEELGIDLSIITRDYFENDQSTFAQNLRKDFKEVVHENTR